MLNKLILNVTKFQPPPSKRLSTVVKNIFSTRIMQVSISSIAPGDLHQKFAPTLGLLHLKLLPGGWGFVRAAPGHFSINDVCHFLNFQELVTNHTLGFTCCSEVLYVLKKIIQS